MRSILLVSLVLASICLFTGCNTVREIRQRPFIPQTNAVATVVSIPAATNVVQSPSGPIEVVIPAKTVTNWSTNITVEVNPAILGGIDGARTINRMANPTPFAPLVDLGLYGLTGILGIVATWKTRKAQKEFDRANAAEAAADHHNELLETVIAGVETANDPKTKEAIAQMSQLWKTRNALDAKVQEVTKT